MILKLTTASIAPLRVEPISVFASAEDALAHICDHVLTQPESHFWWILIAEFRQYAEPTDDSALNELAMALWNEQRQHHGQHLYDGYAELIRQNLEASLRWSFFWEETRPRGTGWCGLGLGGVYVIWSAETVITGMLVAYAAPTPRETVSWHDRRRNPRPRKDLWTRNRGAMRACPESADDTTRYLLFRKCAECVSREFLIACNEGRVRSADAFMRGLDDIPTKSLWQALQ